MNSFMLMLFVSSALAHSHGHSSGHSGHSGESGGSGGGGSTHHSHRTFTYKVAATSATYPVLVSYFITTNFMNLVHKSYNYNNDNNFTTYYIYYYSEIDDTKCIYFDSEFNSLDYTFVDYSNINLINNTNKINYSLVSKRYCEKMDNTNYVLIIGIILLIMICCCICFECKDNNKIPLY